LDSPPPPPSICSSSPGSPASTGRKKHPHDLKIGHDRRHSNGGEKRECGQQQQQQQRNPPPVNGAACCASQQHPQSPRGGVSEQQTVQSSSSDEVKGSGSSNNNNNNNESRKMVRCDSDGYDSSSIDEDDLKKPGCKKNGGGGGNQRGEGDGDDDLYLYTTSKIPVMDRVVRSVQTFRYHCGRIVNHKRVQLFIVLLIAINALMMGIGTFDFVTENPPVESAFEVVDRIFLIIFTIELGMQFVYLGWRILLDGWLVFDLIIILTSWSFASVQIIRAFRIFRALRLITRIKVMKNLVLGM
jgi:hypothetical protein